MKRKRHCWLRLRFHRWRMIGSCEGAVLAECRGCDRQVWWEL